MVDGTAYTGWLTDTDGHRYYFNKDGIMQTGWITLGKKRYYLDEDGIMQTGTITVNGKNTHWQQTVHSKMIFRYIRATKMQVLPEPAFY